MKEGQGVIHVYVICYVKDRDVERINVGRNLLHSSPRIQAVYGL